MNAPLAATLRPGAEHEVAHRRRVLLALLATGTIMEIVLLAGWLLPLSFARTSTNLPAGAPLVLIYGHDPAGALRFAVPSALLIALWVLALWLARYMQGRSALLLTLGMSALMLATLLPMYPGGTQDIYHNVADGRLFWQYDVNPTRVPPQVYADDPFIRHVWGYAELPSAYGPLWYIAGGLPTALAGDGLVANLVAQKALVAGFMLATVIVVVLAVHAVAPERTTLAVVLSGWCPLLIFESAGNGHNDSLMAFFLAVALLAAVQRAHLWVLPLLVLSALVKYTTALVLPVALIWLLRRPDVRGREIVAGLALAAVISAVAFLPLYAGRDTIAALQRPGMTFILSPATLLHGALSGRLTDTDASRVARLLTGGLFAALYGATLLRARGDARELAARSFDALFAYLLFASWWFWPWYLTWLAPVAALSRGGTRPAAFAAAGGAALLTYLYWWPDPIWQTARWFLAYSLIAVGVFLVPGAVWVAGLWQPRRVGRTKRAAL